MAYFHLIFSLDVTLQPLVRGHRNCNSVKHLILDLITVINILFIPRFLHLTGKSQSSAQGLTTLNNSSQNQKLHIDLRISNKVTHDVMQHSTPASRYKTVFELKFKRRLMSGPDGECMNIGFW